jgi:4a-hydroxytetrahydrobiopterin dehydratase
MSELNDKHCVPCEGGIPPLSPERVNGLLASLHHDWALTADGKAIERSYKFKNYYQTIAFVNALAWIANREDHHPDLSVHYNRCVVRYSTHAVDGLTDNDFICAAKVDRLVV